MLAFIYARLQLSAVFDALDNEAERSRPGGTELGLERVGQISRWRCRFLRRVSSHRVPRTELALAPSAGLAEQSGRSSGAQAVIRELCCTYFMNSRGLTTR